MPDHETCVNTDDSEGVPNSEPSASLAQGQKESKRLVIYGEGGEEISIEPPSEEEIDELLYRLESGDESWLMITKSISAL